MAEQTFAATLRLQAQEARGYNGEPFAEPEMVSFHPDEADAIADALDAATRISHYGWGVDAPVGLEVAHIDLQAALDRLNARVAVKSAEGQPGS